MITMINGNYEIIETIDDFYILLEQQMGREVRQWLEEEIDELADMAVEASYREDM